MTRVDQACADGDGLMSLERLDHVPKPVVCDGVDVVVEETQELAAGDRERLVVRLRKRAIGVVPDDARRKGELE